MGIKDKEQAAQVILTYDRKEKRVKVEIRNFEGVPATALDRVDILIEKALFVYRQKERLAAAEASRKLVV